MSNIGLHSNPYLVATDLSLNGNLTVVGNVVTAQPFNIVASTEEKNNTQVNSIFGYLTASLIKQTNRRYTYYYSPSPITTITTLSTYCFTNLNNTTGLQMMESAPNFTIANTNGIFKFPHAGWFLITGQICFNSNTAGNRYVLNSFSDNGTVNTGDLIPICQVPVSYSTPFIQPFNVLVRANPNNLFGFHSGWGFSITVTNYQGPDVIQFGGNKFETSFLKVVMLG